MNPKEFRDYGHILIDRLADYLADVEKHPLFPSVEPAFLQKLFDENLPQKPLAAEKVLGEVWEKLIPYCTHVNHPGYFGLMTPSPAPIGILGDLLASALNQNIGAYSVGPSGVAMERRTVRWLADLVGYGPAGGGHLTSGGMMANLVGMKLARDFVSGDRIQNEGISEKWAVYASEERHVSIDKSVDTVGIGRNFLRAIPTNDDFEIRTDLLEETLRRDQEQGIRPACIIGLAGSTNTGSVDPLPALREIADRYQVWFHVDAAYGGGMTLSRQYSGILKGLELADSITLDPHKWFYAPLDAGAILVKDSRRLTQSFGMKPAYLTDEFDEGGERYQYYVHSLEQSRRFRSLKVWMSFKRYGGEQIGKWIDSNISQALHLHELVRQHPNFVSAVKPRMSAICIRYIHSSMNEQQLTAIHNEAVRRIERGGMFWISTTQLKGKSWFRINPINFRTRSEHMDQLLDLLNRECEVLRKTTR